MFLSRIALMHNHKESASHPSPHDYGPVSCGLQEPRSDYRIQEQISNDRIQKPVFPKQPICHNNGCKLSVYEPIVILPDYLGSNDHNNNSDMSNNRCEIRKPTVIDNHYSNNASSRSERKCGDSQERVVNEQEFSNSNVNEENAGRNDDCRSGYNVSSRSERKCGHSQEERVVNEQEFSNSNVNEENAGRNDDCRSGYNEQIKTNCIAVESDIMFLMYPYCI